MREDEGLRRIREARHRISAACDHDVEKLLLHYQKLQQRYADRLIRFEEVPVYETVEAQSAEDQP